MSRPRSRSPHYRRFPWEEPGFDTYKVLAELDGNPKDRSHRHRKDSEEHWDYFSEDIYPEGQRRSLSFPDDRQFGHQRRPDEEECYRRRPSPHYDVMGYDDRRLSMLRNVGGDGDRRRGGLREHFRSFENRGRLPHSAPSSARERLPQTPRSHTDHQQREPAMGWREEQGRGRGRFRDLSPSARTEDQRGGAGRERGRRNAQGPNRDRRREDPHQERNPTFKRQRREMDDTNHLGYKNEEDFGEQRYSVDTPRDGFRGNIQESLPHGDSRHLRPLVIEHDHGIVKSRKPPRWEQFDDRRDLDPDFDRQRSPRSLGSSQERFRTSDSRSDDREGMRGRRFQDNWRDSKYLEARRSPMPQDRSNPMRYGNRDGSVDHKGRGGLRPARGRLNRGQGGRTGPPRNQPHLQHSSQDYQDLPHEEQRPGYRPFRKDCYEDPIEGEPNWAGEERLQQWDNDRPGSLDRHLPRNDLDPKMPRHRERRWNDQKTSNMTAVKEETLTIKVDMSRPVNENSPLCYSSDRQLSLDLVNVGRQRLDFLPMLEHSGTYRESAMHTGTFAQEIITLVHQVKEQYFRDEGVTLTERFSAPQKGGYSEEETEELTLDERFSSNRGFSLNMNSLLDDDEPLFSRLGPIQGLSQQPVRGPGDLRHDLERRRQERLEGVKVTIPGSSMSQRTLGPVSEPDLEYSDKDKMNQMEDEGFSTWPEEQSRRREGSMVPRRGASYRPNTGSQRRNNRFGSRVGSMRRQSNRNNPAGPNW
ncbi:BCLAF1 and THRAP3 family member 3 isoform X1 [Xiphias gladius]|uniref:BCLAF1 and THRAP3 family member 3 isoform X1 n=1 Tax=Xiphias gladius TaxID=8245 RepID=UPI001A98D92F|nr:BCLAF1 and THRAP3 family member 3 isoform X1 [Xiphias gladius]XP_039982216.1 BCLAF1 and THRAP3 family member 3 isoform X1 [Xiphias gladius]XP_039982217.1 BCLAF1 and THRAP3 family member 3 isoform X1 [Xiphias gladius]XP_039982218.1 BCLAF1 and THRAP3 family member 3 isoform X1 [Xiphias gladius]